MLPDCLPKGFTANFPQQCVKQFITELKKFLQKCNLPVLICISLIVSELRHISQPSEFFLLEDLLSFVHFSIGSYVSPNIYLPICK